MDWGRAQKDCVSAPSHHWAGGFSPSSTSSSQPKDSRTYAALLLLAAQEAPQPAAQLLLLAAAGLRLQCSSLRKCRRRPSAVGPSGLCLTPQPRDVLLDLPQPLGSGAEQLVRAAGCRIGQEDEGL